ncbi:MFS transporter [Gordonia hydrophobica]|uniref:MFS transporter n=1 Tax=Gordonia hydrophobica TaxID=40516 RepID=A0ABZ2U6T8_9ACTN|nr:MFS transporter [Gordonia hydrophobica]MBM7368292.1 MFS family permease [Gordonia hydrophobica]
MAFRRPHLIQGFSDATPVVRLLVLTQLAFNVGFFMVLPYLSVHLSSDLGQATAVVGAVLGLRTVSQQGLFFVGGTIADRIGTRPTVLAGCAVRIVGLLMLGLTQSVAGVAVGAALTGFAGALFSPAVEAALARNTGSPDGSTSRLDGFALFTAFGQIGAFTGPLIGAVLLQTDFTIVAVTGAVVFVFIGLAHLRWLPAEPPAHAGGPLVAGLSEILHNRIFLGFALVMSVQLVAYNQLYLLLPLELERGWGSQAPLGVLMAASSLAVVVGQLRVASWAGRLRLRVALATGLVVSAVGLSAAAIGAAVGGAVPVIIGTASFVLLMALGQMIASPTARAAVPVLAGERFLGSYYGVYASIAGMMVLPASSLLGIIVDAAGDTALGRAAPWLAMVAVMLCAATLMLAAKPRRTAAAPARE